MGKQSEHSHVREIWAVVLVGFALLLLLSLISYEPFDVGNSAGTTNRAIANFIGPVGAWLAFIAFQGFGLGAYFLMVVLTVLGTTLLLQQEIPWRGKAGAGLLLLFSSCCLLHIAGLGRLVKSLNLPDSAGGYVGLFAGGAAEHTVGRPGAVIIFGVFYLISLIILINFRPSYWVALTATSLRESWESLRAKKKPDLERALKDKERDIKVRQYKLEKEAKKAKKLESEEEDVEEVLPPPPPPKFTDYSVARTAKGSESKSEKTDGAASIVEKLTEKLSPKKPAPEEPNPPPKPKRDKPVETEATVIGGASAASGDPG